MSITKEFLTKALGDETEILSYKVTPGTKPGDNFTSIIYAIEIQLRKKDGSLLTRHLLMKCYPTHPARQEFNNKTNQFFKEMEIYREWMPELRRFQTEVIGLKPNETLKLPYAPYVHGVCIDFDSLEKKHFEKKTLDSLDNFIIMEDIRKTGGYRMTNRSETWDIDHLRLVIEALAKVHSLSWAYKSHVEIDVKKKFPFLIPNLTKDDVDLWMQVLEKQFDLVVIPLLDKAFGVGNKFSEATNKFRKIIPKIMEAYIDGKSEITEAGLEKLLRIQNNETFGKDAPNPELWRVICQGDCNTNNMLFQYDEKTGKPVDVILVDLQLAQETCVVNDLQYVLYTSTSGDLRKNHLEELLKLYHDKFNEFCKLLKTETLPGFNLESLRFRFHRGKLLGLFWAHLVLPGSLKEEDDKRVNMEDMEEEKDLADMFEDGISGNDRNTVYHKRIIEITQELYAQGVI